ncbi:MAG: hypothetical protein QME52_05115 [Bacteroidota bacterium]|nr:hypothetical protein [Bacteroidota bacterium]
MIKYFVIIVLASFAFVLSSIILRRIILHVNPNCAIQKRMDWKDVGLWIGLCEFVLILMFVFVEEYTAIAIIFAAKELVRAEDIKKNPSYYLLGTLLNVTLSILSAILIKHITIFYFS